MVTRIALAQISASKDKNININKGEAFMKKAGESSVTIICFPMLSFSRYFPQYNQESKIFRSCRNRIWSNSEPFSESCTAIWRSNNC